MKKFMKVTLNVILSVVIGLLLVIVAMEVMDNTTIEQNPLDGFRYRVEAFGEDFEIDTDVFNKDESVIDIFDNVKEGLIDLVG